MGRLHLRALAALPDVEPVLVVDPYLPTNTLPGIPIVGSIDEAAALGIDLAVLAARSPLHEQLGLQLAGLGVPTWWRSRWRWTRHRPGA